MKPHKGNPRVVLAALMSGATLTSIASGALLINAGNNPAGDPLDATTGPDGLSSGYIIYNTAHEDMTTGDSQTFAGITFAGVGGPYSVDVSFTYTGEDPGTLYTARQSFDRNEDFVVSNFFEHTVGIDTRQADGYTLVLGGLPANTTFDLKSYHFDPDNQAATFTTDLTGDTVFTQQRGQDLLANDANIVNAFNASGELVDPGLFNPDDHAYEFTLVSDGGGNASITYTAVSGTFHNFNGFELEAVPEPSSAALVGLGAFAFLARRRRS